jgi:hypothetical protein
VRHSRSVVVRIGLDGTWSVLSDAIIEVLRDTGDEIRARVSAVGDGYLVVADPLQYGWDATVDGRPVRFTQHPAGEDGDWVAIVHESGMEIAVTARGMTPAEVELTLGVDPEPYLAGLHHGLQRAKAKLARARR